MIVNSYLLYQQERFENSEVTEIELRNLYRLFYKLDAAERSNLDKWIEKYPSSYAAHLARGIYYKRLGQAARGYEFIAETSQKEIDAMLVNFEIAESELISSLALTEKPFLSIFHLSTIMGHLCRKQELKKLLDDANKILPLNTLMRNRYQFYLSPKWCGSHDEMKAFIQQAKDANLPESHILQLKAIMEDDMASLSLSNGDRARAVVHYMKALNLAERVGGSFQEDWLFSSNYNRCRVPELKKRYCK
ncbi:MAG: DUF4034 domain-containing protein, partial [Leptolyngbya sp. SIO4C5]|nr:DUF4034 domain-containing protein [Leptolyngbya sp. SIO4C5]